MYQVNKLEQSYQKGKPLPTGMNTQISQNASYCSYRTLSRNLGIIPASVSNILKLYCDMGCLKSRPQKHFKTQSEL